MNIYNEYEYSLGDISFVCDSPCEYSIQSLSDISFCFSNKLGLCQGKPVEWMDAIGKEVTLWQSVVERAGLWVEGSLPLRISMERPVGE